MKVAQLPGGRRRRQLATSPTLSGRLRPTFERQPRSPLGLPMAGLRRPMEGQLREYYREQSVMCLKRGRGFTHDGLDTGMAILENPAK